MLARLARVEPELLLHELTATEARSSVWFATSSSARSGLAQAAGELIDIDPEPLAEVAVRLGASLVLMPDSVIASDDEQRTRETVSGLIATLLR